VQCAGNEHRRALQPERQYRFPDLHFLERMSQKELSLGGVRLQQFFVQVIQSLWN
jgi:hypothetical protein